MQAGMLAEPHRITSLTRRFFSSPACIWNTLGMLLYLGYRPDTLQGLKNNSSPRPAYRLAMSSAGQLVLPETLANARPKTS